MWRAGWAQPVGTATIESVREVTHSSGLVYQRFELRRLRLSQAAALYLLQGASVRQLLGDVLLTFNDSQAAVVSLAMATVCSLTRPPFVMAKVVLAHVMKRPDTFTEEELQSALLLPELGP